MDQAVTRESTKGMNPGDWFEAVFNGLPSEYVWAMFFVLAMEGARVNGPRKQYRYGTQHKPRGGWGGKILRTRCKRKH